MRIIYLGTPDFAVPPLEALCDGGHEVVLVVTQPDAPRGRGRKLSAPAVKTAALRLGLTVCQPADINGPDGERALRDVRPELGIAVAYGQILKQETLSVFPHGALNLHASLLPKYRGAAPINWAIIRGEKETGVTVQRMSTKMDAGAILAQERVPISEDDTAGDLHDKLCGRGAELLVDVVNRLSRGEEIPEESQEPGDVTYAPKLTKGDSHIEWSLPAGVLRNRIRGLTPWPGAVCRFIGQTRSEDATLLDVATGPAGAEAGTPGTVLSADDAAGIVVQAGQGTIIIKRLKPSGGKAMTAADFRRGRAVHPGDRVE